ncbi:hypothetical protein H3009_gp33 [Bacillus phage Harambe]|uniref:Uncharacterized protein n=2 Tax=Harambevirus TaxID=2842721 RepID=A0A1W6JSD6_9CAUD|nr:hypothetical protein H3009_gp33 [Bacillus phage Harambe]YP_009910209.1 hypothetical protein H3010_gp30 [Bacillus phage BeachBum]ARM70182.1 hypothetical protein HARAMBE_33 [Bacillus phage Harambe]ARQ95211.1 hypothetical protein BEACHBUM_30 [Bacillus phage BeachBum]
MTTLTKKQLLEEIKEFAENEMSHYELTVSVKMLGLGETKYNNIINSEIYSALESKLTKQQVEELHTIVTTCEWEEVMEEDEESVDKNIGDRLMEKEILESTDTANKQLKLDAMKKSCDLVILSIGIERYINSSSIEEFAIEKGYNLAEFVYQIVLAYNEISSSKTPIAKKVSPKEPSFVDSLIETWGLEVELIEEIETNEIQILDNGIVINVVNKQNFFHVFYEDERKGRSENYKLIYLWEVNDLIDQKLNK